MDPLLKTPRRHTTSLLNRQNLRAWILYCAKEERAHEYTQVASSVFNEAEGILRRWAYNKVRQQPSKGKTIK